MMSRDKYMLCNAVAPAGVWIMINLMMYVDRAADNTDCKYKLCVYTVCYSLKRSIKSKVIKKMVVCLEDGPAGTLPSVVVQYLFCYLHFKSHAKKADIELLNAF